MGAGEAWGSLKLSFTILEEQHLVIVEAIGTRGEVY